MHPEQGNYRFCVRNLPFERETLRLVEREGSNRYALVCVEIWFAGHEIARVKKMEYFITESRRHKERTESAYRRGAIARFFAQFA